MHRVVAFATTLMLAIVLTAAVSMAGDAAKGEAIAKGCKCHGKQLDGRSAADIVKQLKDFKEGRRFNKLMEKKVAKMSDEDMENVAAWYESLK